MKARLNMQNRHVAVLIIAMVIHLLHQLWFYEWYIEDAAITFSFAKYWVLGEGLVPFPGAERVEGYSNPTWMALIAFWYALGVDPFASSKIMAAIFGTACLPMAYLLAREAMPDDDSPAPLAAPILLAFSAHHAIWSASALENSLYNLLILTGSWLVLREQKSDRYPWSAVAFLLMALTRPDGLMYAAIGGFYAMVFTVRAGRGWKRTLQWLAVFWLPYLAFIAVRFWYFAYPLPSTFYAKTATRGTWLNMYKWYWRGWSQVRLYSQLTWTGFFLPVFVLAMLGTKGRRGQFALGICVLGALLLLIPGPDSVRNQWFWPEIISMKDNEAVFLPYLRFRLALLCAFILMLPLLVIGRPGWRARLVVYSMAAASTFFQVFTDGDWMQGLRWFSMLAPTQAILMAIGIDELARFVTRKIDQPRWGTGGWLVSALLVCMWVPPNLNFSANYKRNPDDFPLRIQQRVAHKQKLIKKLFLEEQARTLDMDMGAHMYWSDMEMIDMAGLINTPIAMHTYWDRPFIEEYVFGEKNPHFAHVHLRWAEISMLKTYDHWKKTYIQYTGYRQGPLTHDGMWARRDLFVRPTWDGPRHRLVHFGDGIELVGWDIPSPEVGRGRALFIETAWRSRPRERNEEFFVTLTLSNDRGRLASWDLPMGYTMEGNPILPSHQWAEDDIFIGRYGLNLLPDLPEGDYDLGISVRGPKGGAIPAGGKLGKLSVAPGSVVGGTDSAARYATGEIRFPAAVHIVSRDEVDRFAEEDRLAALEFADRLECEKAEEHWILARRHIPLHDSYKKVYEAEIGAAISRCWAKKADLEPAQAMPWLIKAKAWDHREPTFIRVRKPHADRLYAEGLAARKAEDWETAFARFNAVLSIDASRSWARRYTEEARDHRLGLPMAPPPKPEKKKGIKAPETLRETNGQNAG